MGRRSLKEEKEEFFKNKYKLTEEIISNIDEDLVREQWVIIKELVQNGDFKSYEDLQSITDSLYLLCTETGFLDKNKDFLNKGIIGEMKGYIETEYCNNPEVKKKGKQLLLTTKDIADQLYFSTEDQRPRPEILANMMNLSNLMAHLVDANDITEKFMETGEDKKEEIKRIFMVIKDKCIEELVESKQNGENLFMEIREDDDGNDKLYVAIPGYFEPFSVHTKNKQINLENSDNIEFTNYDKSKMDDLLSVFPFRVSEKKEKIIRDYMDPRRTQPKELEKLRDRLLWYLNTQDKFREIHRKKEELNKEAESVVDSKKLTIEEQDQNKDTTKKRKRTKRPEKAEEFKKINSEFLEKINEQLDGAIEPNMVDKFLHRASYSFENLVNGKLRTIAMPFFKEKELDEEQVNKELSKIFIYMRMFSKLSVINMNGVDNQKSIEFVKDAFENYEKAFEFMQKNKGQNLSYDNMKKGIQKYLENKEETKEELKFEENKLETDEISESEIEVDEIGKSEIEADEPEDIAPKEDEFEDNKLEENEIKDQEQEYVNPDFEELRNITGNVEDAKEIKEFSKESILLLKEKRKELKKSIERYENEIDQLMQSEGSKDTIIEQIKALRSTIKEQKALRKEIKGKIKKFKLQKEQAKYTIKENQEKRGKIIDRL